MNSSSTRTTTSTAEALPLDAEAAEAPPTGPEIQCCADAKGGKWSPISSTSEPHPAHNWRLTAVTECNWIYESAAERPARASVTVTFQLPGDEGGRDLRGRCDEELSNRLDAAAGEAEGLKELADFREAGKRLAAAMNAVAEARAALAESEGRLENFAAGGPGAEESAYSVLLDDRDRDRQRLALAGGPRTDATSVQEAGDALALGVRPHRQREPGPPIHRSRSRQAPRCQPARRDC